MPIKFTVKLVRLKCLHNHCQSYDREQVRLIFDYFLTCNISDSIKDIPFTPGMTVDVHTARMLMLVSITLTLTQGHSGSAKAKIQCWIISRTKQATSIN